MESDSAPLQVGGWLFQDFWVAFSCTIYLIPLLDLSSEL
jgi:hypothetical protein